MAIQTLNTIKTWFKTGLKPSQGEFWDTWDSFRHKFEKIPLKDIEELEKMLDAKAENSQLEEHQNSQNAHSELFSVKENRSEKGIAGGYVPLDEFSKITSHYLNVINDLITGGETSLLSAEQGVVLQNQVDNINTLLSSDNVNLNTIQKIVDVVEQIQMSLDTILVNDLTTGGVTKALTAEMGKLLETSKEDKFQKGIAGGYAPLNNLSKISSQYLTIINDLTTGGSESILSAEQGAVLQNQINGINTLLSSDNVDLDTLQEIVDAIEEVQMSLDTILVNDLTTGGVTKALTAEMGKQLNEIKLTAKIATNEETQIIAPIVEDNKVISRAKLYDWWSWTKTFPQNIYNTWTFYNPLRFGSVANLYGDANSFYIRSYQNKQLCIGVEGLSKDSLLINNDGITAASKLILAKATITTPSLIIPKGVLTTVPQDGAIENVQGNLFYTDGSTRLKLLNQHDTDNFLQTTWRSTSNQAVSFNANASYTNKTNVASFSLPNTTLGGIDIGNYLFKTFDKYMIRNSSYNSKLIPPTSVLFEMYLKGVNCLFSGNEYVRLYSVKRTDIMTRESIRNYEIPLEVVNVYSQGNFLSGLTYSELEFDNLGNIANETYRSYYLKSTTYSGPAVGDLKFSNASIALEIRISSQYDDPLNSNNLNDGCRSIYYNNSCLFIKI